MGMGQQLPLGTDTKAALTPHFGRPASFIKTLLGHVLFLLGHVPIMVYYAFNGVNSLGGGQWLDSERFPLRKP